MAVPLSVPLTVRRLKTTQDGRVRAGKPVNKSLIYRLLNNRTSLAEPLPEYEFDQRLSW